jgi:hypothetical protein
MREKNSNGLVLGLDVSTKTIGIALFDDLGDTGRLKLLHHVTPEIKPLPENKIQQLFDKARIFEEEFLKLYVDVGITKVVIEEPLVRSNNVNTVAILLKFNGIISRSIYEILGIVPEFISSYDSRKYAFPELMQVRTHNRKGEPYTEKEIAKKKPTLFGGYNFNIDKKEIILGKVSELEPQVTWIYNKKNILTKESYDLADAYTCCLGFMHKNNFWV